MSTYVITDPEQVRDWDRQTIEEQGITSLQLMERAAIAFCDRFRERYPVVDYEHVDVVCGPGNNGGDGAAIARLLERGGYTTFVWGCWGEGAARSPDLRANWQALEKMRHPRVRVTQDYQPTLGVNVIIDALFGVGLSRPLEGAYAKTVEAMSPRPVDPVVVKVAVDVPSGLRADGKPHAGPHVYADATFTFEAYKQSALLHDTGPAWGRVEVLSVGLAEYPDWVDHWTRRTMDVSSARRWPGIEHPRARFTHKGDYGHVLVIAGSRGHAGAALLSGRGALNTGAGLVTFYVPQRLETVMQLGLPEAMCLVDPHGDHLSECPDLGPYDAIVVGPGIGQHADTARMLAQVFAKAGEKACVIDADALNLVAADSQLFARLPTYSILTPHPGEFARLAGHTDTGYDRLWSLDKYATTLPDHATIVLKGQYTAVVPQDGYMSFNVAAGNPGMASGGMGDTLAGVIGALAARILGNECAWDDVRTYGAAVLGVLAHARAGDMVKEEYGEDGVTASRVAEAIGPALGSLYG